MNNPQNPNETTENLHTNDVFSKLSQSQWRYVTAMAENPAFTKKQAAEYIGLTPDTVYRWPDYVDASVDIARKNIHEAALTMRKQSVLKAIAVKISLLDSADDTVRNKAASDLIEWELGKANQPISGKDGGAIEVIFKHPEKPKHDTD